MRSHIASLSKVLAISKLLVSLFVCLFRGLHDTCVAYRFAALRTRLAQRREPVAETKWRRGRAGSGEAHERRHVDAPEGREEDGEMAGEGETRGGREGASKTSTT